MDLIYLRRKQCWSEQLRFFSWNLNWRSNKLKCLNLFWQAQRFWRWAILQISVKNYWENQWGKNQPISSDLQSSFRRRQRHPTPVLLPGKSHGWRSLVGCSPWGHTESDTTKVTQQQQQQSSFRFLFPQWELWPLQSQSGGKVWKSSQFFWLGQLHALSQALYSCYLKKNLFLYGSLVGKSYRQYPQTWYHQVKQSKGLVERLKNSVITFASPQTATAVTIWSVFPSKPSLLCSL